MPPVDFFGSGVRPGVRPGVRGRTSGQTSGRTLVGGARVVSGAEKKSFDRGGPVWPPRSNATDDRERSETGKTNIFLFLQYTCCELPFLTY